MDQSVSIAGSMVGVISIPRSIHSVIISHSEQNSRWFPHKLAVTSSRGKESNISISRFISIVSSIHKLGIGVHGHLIAHDGSLQTGHRPLVQPHRLAQSVSYLWSIHVLNSQTRVHMYGLHMHCRLNMHSQG